MNGKTAEIISTAFGIGSMHDFQLFKDSRMGAIAGIKYLADSGYQGIAKIHSNSQIPKKSSKKQSLTEEEKGNNRAVSRERILVENVIGRLKVFRALSERYRNRSCCDII